MDAKREIEMAELNEDIKEAKKEKAAALLAGHVSLAEKVQEGLNIMLRRLEEKEKQGESQPPTHAANFLLPCMNLPTTND